MFYPCVQIVYVSRNIFLLKTLYIFFLQTQPVISTILEKNNWKENLVNLEQPSQFSRKLYNNSPFISLLRNIYFQKIMKHVPRECY